MKIRKLDISKYDKLTAIATLSIGFEFIPHYLGLDLKGFTIAWIVLPGVLLVSFVKHKENYLSPRLLGWVSLFFITLILYALIVDWNEDIPFLRVPEVLRGFSLSLIVFAFYMVHGRTPKGRKTFFMILTFIGVIAAFINILGLFGLTDTGAEVGRIGGGSHLVRISPMGDPNITTIYLLGLAASFPQWRALLGTRLGIIVGLFSSGVVVIALLPGASRGGTLSVLVTFLAIALVSFRRIKMQKAFILLSLLACIVLIGLNFSKIRLPSIVEPMASRFSVLDERGLSDRSFGLRVGAVKWFIDDILSGPRLLGFGFKAYSVEAMKKGAPILPHNSFIDMYIIGGLIGFLAYGVLWLLCIIAFFRAMRSSSLDDKVLGKQVLGKHGFAFGLGLVSLLVSLSIPFTKIIWAYLGIGMATFYTQKQNRDFKHPPTSKRFENNEW
jgi:O-antigen ligase